MEYMVSYVQNYNKHGVRPRSYYTPLILLNDFMAFLKTEGTCHCKQYFKVED